MAILRSIYWCEPECKCRYLWLAKLIHLYIDHSAVIASSGGTSAYASDIGKQILRIVKRPSSLIPSGVDSSCHFEVVLPRNDRCIVKYHAVDHHAVDWIRFGRSVPRSNLSIRASMTEIRPDLRILSEYSRATESYALARYPRLDSTFQHLARRVDVLDTDTIEDIHLYCHWLLSLPGKLNSILLNDHTDLQ